MDFQRFAGLDLNLLSSILLRIADPVEPFYFELVQNNLLPPLLEDICDNLGKQAGLFDQLEDG
jgi:hypothetical protein